MFACDFKASRSPSTWAQGYVGLPYILGAGECAHRAALVWRQVFGYDIEVPAAHGNLRVAQRLIRSALATSDWAPTKAPQEGDAVAMWKGDLLCHVGVYVAGGYVLHCTKAEGMVLTAEDDLQSQGFRVFGYFRWHGRRVAEALAA
jgi:hypothetical protein